MPGVFVGDGWPLKFPKQEEKATQLCFLHARNIEKHPTTGKTNCKYLIAFQKKFKLQNCFLMKFLGLQIQVKVKKKKKERTACKIKTICH